MQIQSQISNPLQTHQPMQVANRRTPAPSETIKVKSRTTERMQELHAEVKKKGESALGSSAQAKLIKAKIEAVPVTGIRDQAQKVSLTKTQTAKKYGLIALRVLGGLATAGLSELVINRKTIGGKIGRAFSNTTQNMDISVSQRYASSGSKAKQGAKLLSSIVETQTQIETLKMEVGAAKAKVDDLRAIHEGRKPMPSFMNAESVTNQLGEAINAHKELKSKLGIAKQTLIGLQEQTKQPGRVKDLIQKRDDLRDLKTVLPRQIENAQERLQALEKDLSVEREQNPRKLTRKADDLMDKIAAVKSEISDYQGRLGAVNEALHTHRTESQSLITLARQLELESRSDTEVGAEIMDGAIEVAHEYVFKGLLTTAKAAHSSFSLVTNAAMLGHHVSAVAQGTSAALSVADSTKDAAAASIGVTTSAISTASLVAAPVTILVEGYALKQSVTELASSYSKVQRAELLLDEGKRGKEIKSLEGKLQKAEFGSDKHKLLAEKLTYLKSLPSPEDLSPESQAVAKQVIKHADMGFKGHSAAKSVIAITGASLTIASLALGPLAPAGLVVAATVVGVMAGAYGLAMLVSKFKIPRKRQAKIDTLVNNHQQIQMKKQSISAEKGKLSTRHEVKSLAKQVKTEKQAALKKFIETGVKPDAMEMNRLKLKPADFASPETAQGLVDALGGEIAGLDRDMQDIESQVNDLDTSLKTLSDLQSDNTLQLLASSPYDGAKVIYEGATAVPPDASMSYISKGVLGVDCAKLSPEVAIEELARGMSIKPGS